MKLIDGVLWFITCCFADMAIVHAWDNKDYGHQYDAWLYQFVLVLLVLILTIVREVVRWQT